MCLLNKIEVVRLSGFGTGTRVGQRASRGRRRRDTHPYCMALGTVRATSTSELTTRQHRIGSQRICWESTQGVQRTRREVKYAARYDDLGVSPIKRADREGGEIRRVEGCYVLSGAVLLGRK